MSTSTASTSPRARERACASLTIALFAVGTCGYVEVGVALLASAALIAAFVAPRIPAPVA